MFAKTYADKVSWNSVVDRYGFKQINSQTKRPSQKGTPEEPKSFQDTVLLPEISKAWEEFQASPRRPEDLRVLAHKALSVVKVGYLAPYIRDLQLKEGTSPLDRELESILIVNKTASKDGSELYKFLFTRFLINYFVFCLF